MAAKKLKFKPLGLNILIEPEKAETTTKSGVVLVQKDEERPQKGTVVALGAGFGHYKDPMGNTIMAILKEGDKILFKKYGGNEVELDGDKYLVLSEVDILGIIEG